MNEIMVRLNNILAMVKNGDAGVTELNEFSDIIIELREIDALKMEVFDWLDDMQKDYVEQMSIRTKLKINNLILFLNNKFNKVSALQTV